MERTPLDVQLFHPADEIPLQAVRAGNYRLAFPCRQLAIRNSWRLLHHGTYGRYIDGSVYLSALSHMPSLYEGRSILQQSPGGNERVIVTLITFYLSRICIFQVTQRSAASISRKIYHLDTRVKTFDRFSNVQFSNARITTRMHQLSRVSFAEPTILQTVPRARFISIKKGNNRARHPFAIADINGV